MRSSRLVGLVLSLGASSAWAVCAPPTQNLPNPLEAPNRTPITCPGTIPIAQSYLEAIPLSQTAEAKQASANVGADGMGRITAGTEAQSTSQMDSKSAQEAIAQASVEKLNSGIMAAMEGMKLSSPAAMSAGKAKDLEYCTKAPKEICKAPAKQKDSGCTPTSCQPAPQNEAGCQYMNCAQEFARCVKEDTAVCVQSCTAFQQVVATSAQSCMTKLAKAGSKMKDMMKGLGNFMKDALGALAQNAKGKGSGGNGQQPQGKGAAGGATTPTPGAAAGDYSGDYGDYSTPRTLADADTGMSVPTEFTAGEELHAAKPGGNLQRAMAGGNDKATYQPNAAAGEGGLGDSGGGNGVDPSLVAAVPLESMYGGGDGSMRGLAGEGGAASPEATPIAEGALDCVNELMCEVETPEGTREVQLKERMSMRLASRVKPLGRQEYLRKTGGSDQAPKIANEPSVDSGAQRALAGAKN